MSTINRTLLVGNSVGIEIPSGFEIVMQQDLPAHMTAGQFEAIEKMAYENEICKVLIVGASLGLLINFTRFVNTLGRNWIFGEMIEGEFRITELELPYKRQLARVFIEKNQKTHADGTVIFSGKPETFYARLVPAILDLSKVTSVWSYTDHNGGWVNPDAISHDLTHWGQAMEWNQAWDYIQTSEFSY